MVYDSVESIWSLLHRCKHEHYGHLLSAVDGMATAPARMLLWDLLEHATDRRFVLRHEWQQHDVLMWDNQCTLHRGRPYDLGARRELRRCTTEVVAA